MDGDDLDEVEGQGHEGHEGHEGHDQGYDTEQGDHRRSSLYRQPPSVIVYTASNLDIYNAVIYEEEGELMPPDEDLLSQRRLSTSLPYGLDLIGLGDKAGNADTNGADSSSAEGDATCSPTNSQPIQNSNLITVSDIKRELCMSPPLPMESIV